MDIQAFIQLSCGHWFTQRTCHQLGHFTSEAQTAQLEINALKLNVPDVVCLCEAAKIDPDLALCAARVSWQSQGFQLQSSEDGMLLMVLFASDAAGQQGQLLQQESHGPISQLNFDIDSEQRLVLTGSQDQMILEERVWFASPNLRLRNSLLKQSGQLYQATWYSEVRMGGLPAPDPTEIAASASTP